MLQYRLVREMQLSELLIDGRPRLPEKEDLQILLNPRYLSVRNCFEEG